MNVAPTHIRKTKQKMAPRRIYVVGIAGASGSGKSHLARQIQSGFGPDSLLLLQDNYYKDLSHLSMQERTTVNFDHPEAIEFKLFEHQIRDLMRGLSVLQPLYDFKTHTRKSHHIKIAPKDIIIVEGTLIFTLKNLRRLFDLKIYVDTPLDICFIRRLSRDCRQRSRSTISVVDQYLGTVRPMYLQYIQPTRKYADFVLEGYGSIDSKMKKIIHHIDSTLKNKV
jgi:uridine kinase